MIGLPTIHSLLWLVCLLLVAKVLQILYRFTFHPLARFPGPKLAAATNLFGAYYDLIEGGNYVKHLPEWHDKYGPIIRTYPNELHIRDSGAYNEVYKIGTKFDKDPLYYSNPFFNGSLFNFPDLKTTKQRKDMFQMYFSKAAIVRVQPLLKQSISEFLGLLKVASRDRKAVDLSLGFRCLTADMIMNYCYQKPFGALAAPDFKFPLIVTIDKYAAAGLYDEYFPKAFAVVSALMNAIPFSIARRILPPLSSIQFMQTECRKEILALKNRPRSADAPFPTIFDTMLNPNTEKGQYTPSNQDLTAEAMLMLSAGMDTTSHTLVLGTWHVLCNARIHQILFDELSEAMPDKDAMYDLAVLESLPYLRAVVKESLRLSYGAPGRLPRIVPPSGATFCGQDIPPGTVVSHSSYVYHADESKFRDAAVFSPERWLGDGFAEMDRNMVSFSRGSRGCLGINLAYAELHLLFAHLFRRFSLVAHKTTAADMEWGDYFVTIARGHLKVMVHEAG